jgi:hypothetical protein
MQIYGRHRGLDVLEAVAAEEPVAHALKALRSFIDGFQKLAAAGGPVSRIVLGPNWRIDEIADRDGTPGVRAHVDLTTVSKTTKRRTK